jgi:hypothetical protein
VACGPDTIAVGAPESTEQVGAGAGRVRGTDPCPGPQGDGDQRLARGAGP